MLCYNLENLLVELGCLIMIKKYYLVIKKFFDLKAHKIKLVIELFTSALLRSLAFLLVPYAASLIVDAATNELYFEALIYALFFLGCSLVYVVFHHWNYTSYCKNSVYMHNKVQENIFNKVTNFDQNFTKNMSSAFVVNTAFNDVRLVVQIPDLMCDVIAEVINVICALIILLKVDFLIGGLALVLNILSMYCMYKNMVKRDYYLDNQRKHQDSVSSLMGQVLDGNKEIKSFNMEEDLDYYLENYKKLWKKNFFKTRLYSDNIWVLVPCILELGKIAVYLIMIYLILNGKYDVAMLVLVIGYYENIQSKVSNLFTCLDTIARYSIRVDRVHKIIHYKNKNMLDFGQYNKDDIAGKVEFRDVTFKYESLISLKNVSFEIKPNSFVAIVGKSGSGKSTIFRLLLRLYKCNKGQILLDDKNIYDYKQKVYSSNVSIVTQKPFMFDMSIKENFNLVDSNFDNQVAACKRVGIHDYIMSLKDGYNTKLLSDAENISGGQKQLMALARILLSKSEVLLFDEVTSTLDLNTSKKVMKILKDLKKDHTIMMITHKPSLMKLADEILVIDHGKLVGRGTHKELLENNKYYQILQK